MTVRASLLLLLSSPLTVSRRKSSQDLEKYFAASTEDTAKLFQLEKDLWELVLRYNDSSASIADRERIRQFVSQSHFDKVVSEDSLAHVSHPLNAYHCLKRTTSLWQPMVGKLSEQNKLKKAKQILRKFPETEDFEEGGAFGLLTLQHYYNISYEDMMSGNILTDRPLSVPGLQYEDALTISRMARHVQRLDKQVSWLRVAAEHCDGPHCERLRSELERAEEDHDDVLLSRGLGATTHVTPDGLPEVPVFTFLRPVELTRTSEVYQRSLSKYERERRLVGSGRNIKLLEVPTEMKFLSRTFHRMWYYGHDLTRELCGAGKVESSRRHHCDHLHHQEPYLRLGPFKYELLSSEPHVGMFRDFYSPAECEAVRRRAEGNIRSSPFTAGGRTKYFTSQRVSKRLHISEEQFELAAQSSKRISLATSWIVDQEPGASDEYNIINYGLGGQIEVHVDYWNTDNKRPGGARVATFLGYLTDLRQGGRTVFPGLGLAVTPERGSALFWLTVDTAEDYDSRMYHMGCPVAGGNKWVFTKWIYSNSQMWKYPCARKEGNYPSFSNQKKQR